MGRSRLVVASLWRRHARRYGAAARWLLVLGLLQANLLGFAPLTAEATTAATTAHEGWQQMPGLVGQRVRWLSIKPGNPQQVFAAVDGTSRWGIYRTNDGGYTWASLGLDRHALQTVSVCPSGLLFAGHWGEGVFKLVGTSWNPLNDGLASPYIVMLYCDSTGTVFAGTTEGLSKMASTGSSWSSSNTGLPSGYVLAMGRQGTTLFAGTQNGVYRSSNNGANWSLSGLAGQKIYDLDFDPTDPQRLWAASSTQGVFGTSDGGATWNNVGGLLNGYTVARDAIEELYVGTSANGAYRYDGAQWVGQMLDATKVYHLRMAGSGSGHLLAATDNGIWTALPDVRLNLRSHTPNGATVGAEITYFIDYRTNGNGIISGVVITNAIPVGTQLASIQNSGSVAGNVVSWNLDPLGPDPTSGTVSYKVWVTQPVGGLAAGLAQSEESDGAEAAQPAAAPSAAAAESAVEPPASETGGSEIPASAPEITPESSPPESGLAAESPNGTAAPPSEVTGAPEGVIADQLSVSGTEISDTVTAPATAPLQEAAATSPEGDVVTNAVQTGDTPTDADGDSLAGPSDPSGIDSAEMPQALMDLSVTKSDHDVSTTPGGTVTYYLTYQNSGTLRATGVTITDTVPANTIFSRPGSSQGWSCKNNAPAGTLCSYAVSGGVAAGGSGSLVFVVSVVSPVAAGVDEITNTASIADDGTNGADPTPGDNTSTDTTPVNAAPDLTLTKSDGLASATPGSTLSYTLFYTNTGNQGASGVTLVETVPANTTYTGTGWNCTDATCTATVGGLASGASGSRIFTVRVNDTVPAGVTQIANTATIADDGANGADPTPGNNTATDVDTLVAAPDLALTKSDSLASTTPGSTLSYTLFYTNAGHLGATGVTLVETLPANTTYAGTGWACTGSTCTASVGALLAGASGSMIFTVKVNDTVPAGANQITNTATITDDGASGNDPTPGNNTATDIDTLVAAPDLTLTKSDGVASTTPGTTLSYTLFYTNTGKQGATGVTLVETLPANTTYIGTGWNCTGSTCTSTVGSLAAGASGSRIFTVRVNDTVPAGVTQITNTATVADDGTNGADPTSGNNTATDIDTLIAAPDLTLTKSDGGAASTPGATLVYALTYQNVGNQAATGVTITDTVPANTTFNAGSSTGAWSCANGSPAGTICSSNIGNVSAGAAAASVNFAVTVANPLPDGVTQISNTARIYDDAANGVEPNSANNIGADTTPVSAALDLTLSKSDNGVTTTPGSILVYTLTYRNVGNQTATGVTITDTVPANTTFNAAGSTGAWSCANGSPAGTICSKSIGNVSAGAPAASVNFAVTVANPLPAGVNQISNTARIYAGGPEPNIANNLSTETTPVNAAPDLTLSKSDGLASAGPGATLSYTLFFTNTGNQGATGVTLAESVPANTTLTGSGWVCSGSTCTAAVGSLAVGASASKAFTVRVNDTVPVGANQISNTAAIFDDGTNGADPTPGNNTATDIDTLIAAPDLTLTKSDGVTSAVPGDTLSYTLFYANAGSRGATGVTLAETLPANTTYAGTGWSCSGATCTAVVGSLAAGASGSKPFTVKLNTTVPAGVIQVSNSATIADDGANGADPTPGNNTATDVDTLAAAPDLILTKTDGLASTAPGGTLSYTLFYTNTGNQGATGVTLAETVPANTTYSGTGWSCTGSSCTATVGSVAAGGSGFRIFAVKVDASIPEGVTHISNTASIADDHANGDDPTPGNNSGTDTTRIDASVNLTLRKVRANTPTPGGELRYSLIYANAGGREATGVILKETVPANTTFDTGASSAGWSCSGGGIAGSACTYTVGRVSGGAGGTVTFAVGVGLPLPAGTPIQNTATLDDDQPGGAVESSDSTTVARGRAIVIVNEGAYVSWQFASGTFLSASSPCVHLLTTFMPLILKLY